MATYINTYSATGEKVVQVGNYTGQDGLEIYICTATADGDSVTYSNMKLLGEMSKSGPGTTANLTNTSAIGISSPYNCLFFKLGQYEAYERVDNMKVDSVDENGVTVYWSKVGLTDDEDKILFVSSDGLDVSPGQNPIGLVKNNTKFWVIFILVLVVIFFAIVFGGGAYYFYRKHKSE